MGNGWAVNFFPLHIAIVVFKMGLVFDIMRCCCAACGKEVRDAALAPARLVVGSLVVDLRPIGLLQLPGDHPVLYEDLPGARPRAVHAVAGADGLVVLPAAPVKFFPAARLV